MNAGSSLPRSGPAAWLVAGILFLIAVCLYLPALKSEFVIDAHCVVVNNPAIKQAKLFPKLWTGELFGACRGDVSPRQAPGSCSPRTNNYFEFNYFRPVVLASFALDYRLWGLDPSGYHLVNVLLHALNCFLFYLLLLLLFQRRNLSFLAAVFFCILPVHEWVVNYTLGRGDLLQATFQLASLLCLGNYLRSGGGMRMAASLFFFALALLSRELAVIQVFLAAAVVWQMKGNVRPALRLTIPFVAVAAAYVVFRSFFLPVNPVGATGLPGLTGMPLDWLRLVVLYLARFLFPWSFQTVMLGWLQPVEVRVIVYGALIFAALVANLLICRQTKKCDLWFGWIWLLAAFLPLLCLVNQFKFLGPVLSEHYLYLAGMGFAAVLSGHVLWLPRLLRRPLIALLVLYYAALLILNNSFWTTEENLLRRVQWLDGDDQRVASEQLLSRYEKDPRVFVRKARLARDPVSQARWWQRAGLLELRSGRFTVAIDHLTRSQHLAPDVLDTLLGLASAYYNAGSKAEALPYLDRAMALYSDSAEVNRFRGLVYYLDGEMEKAVPYFERAYYLNPDSQENTLYLAVIDLLARRGKNTDRLFEKAALMTPKDSFPYRFMAAELFQQGRFSLAVGILNLAAERFPQDPENWLMLGKIYANLGYMDRAQRAWDAVLQFDPGNREARRLLAETAPGLKQP